MHGTKRLPKWLEACLSAGNVLRLGLAAAAAAVAASPAPAAIISVTTTNQEVNTDADCSLQEAIFAANFDAAIAIDPSSLLNDIATGCAAGSGADTIVLTAGATYQMSGIVQDQFNHLGPSANPFIFTAITIQGNGAKLERVGGLDIRLFSVGPASLTWNGVDYDDQGFLSLQDLHIVGFRARGGDGSAGGGGGLGAGGAIYLEGGIHTIERCTFEGNSATGGSGGAAMGAAVGSGGGGGGLAGDGGFASFGNLGGGGGGGGARGNGGASTANPAGSGGGGGGTANNGVVGGGADAIGGNGGFTCGGGGGDHGTAGSQAGLGGTCDGGGGGGGAGGDGASESAGAGGDGEYGGGGGGGGAANDIDAGVGGDGGNGGFGGGGGAGGQGASSQGSGGNGGFGAGGGGAWSGASAGAAGTFAGAGSAAAQGGGGGGGAGLGGAIFADFSEATPSENLSLRNCTFYGNTTIGGTGGSGGGNGESHGQLFINGGESFVTYCTFAGGNSGDVAGNLGETNIIDSILADDIAAGPNCKMFGDVGTHATNVIEVNSATDPCDPLSINPNIYGVDPELVPLALNGPGLTPTMEITTTSPAYDVEPVQLNGLCLGADQRGITRPQSTDCDLGAYELVLINVAVDTAPAGLGITVDGTPYTAPQGFSWALGGPHTIATASPQGGGGTQHVWTSWSDAGAISHSVSPLVDTTYTASFQTQHLLTTAALPPVGGTVTPPTGYHNAGAVVNVLATPAPYWLFTGFSGDLTGTTNPQPVTMDGPRTVTANFVQIIPTLRGPALALLVLLVGLAGLIGARRQG